ncbi:pyridoxal-phosphate dependent enzyme [Acuticoccus sp.]|uniref:pyridoxal-phosphate dependent enzyme n=1 Tax=Acuticoccus sp. TaxID=1904378 RepID=UPI003B521F75
MGLTYVDDATGERRAAGPTVPRPARPYRIADAPAFDPGAVDRAELSLWRYRHAMAVDVSDATWRRTTMGEGATALVAAGERAPGVHLKLEFAMPTLSFKDRGAAAMMAQAAQWGVDRVAVDSSGNAGTAVAAYAARLGMGCDVFVPAGTSAGKLRQIAAHGASVREVPGSREDTADAAHEHVARTGVFHASHVECPLFHQGTKTMVYEIVEQLGGASEVVYLPVGNGTMLLGALLGFADLLSAGVISGTPQVVAVQSTACAPLAEAYAAGEEDPSPVGGAGTIAEGIAIAAPARGREILAALRRASARVVTVDDGAVRVAQAELAAMGFFVEPTAAVTWAACRADPPSRSAVVPLCGAGLKSDK